MRQLCTQILGPAKAACTEECMGGSRVQSVRAVTAALRVKARECSLIGLGVDSEEKTHFLSNLNVV